MCADALHPDASTAPVKTAPWRADFARGMAIGAVALLTIASAADAIAFWRMTALSPHVAARPAAVRALGVANQLDLIAPPVVRVAQAVALAPAAPAPEPEAKPVQEIAVASLTAPTSSRRHLHHHHARARAAASTESVSPKIESVTSSILNVAALREMRLELDAQYTQARRAYSEGVQEDLEPSVLSTRRRDVRDLSRRIITLDALIGQLSSRHGREPRMASASAARALP